MIKSNSQKEIKVIFKDDRYNVMFWTGRIEDAINDFAFVAKKYEEFGTCTYSSTPVLSGQSMNKDRFSILKGIYCPCIHIRENNLKGKIILEQIYETDIQPSDKNLVSYVIDDLIDKGWIEATE